MNHAPIGVSHTVLCRDLLAEYRECHKRFKEKVNLSLNYCAAEKRLLDKCLYDEFDVRVAQNKEKSDAVREKMAIFEARQRSFEDEPNA